MEAVTIKDERGSLTIDTEPGNPEKPIRVTLKAGIFPITVFFTEQQAFDVEEALWKARHEILDANSAKKGGAA